ncbi:hypothetical protein [Acetobacter estunensis]|nr:hypothetical protein [Acetobacter estunensis]
MVHLSQADIQAIAEAVRQGVSAISVHTSGNETLNLSPADIQAIKDAMGNAGIHADNGSPVALHLVDDTSPWGWDKIAYDEY